jgi:hypothetical protein
MGRSLNVSVMGISQQDHESEVVGLIEEYSIRIALWGYFNGITGRWLST